MNLGAGKLASSMRVFVQRAKFYLNLIGSGRARYAFYLIEMRLRGVNLFWVSTRDLGLAEEHAHPHADSGGPELIEILRKTRLPLTSRILDLGCGKGGAAITFARQGYRYVDGVEISSALCAIARCNLEILGIKTVQIIQADAALFSNLDSYDVIYMFNPFPKTVMSAVVANLRESLRRCPRPLLILYRNPTCDDEILEGPFLKSQDFSVGEHSIFVYRADPSLMKN